MWKAIQKKATSFRRKRMPEATKEELSVSDETIDEYDYAQTEEKLTACILGEEDAIERTWGEDFDGLEISVDDGMHPHVQRPIKKPAEPPIHNTRKAKRHGSIWHTSIRSDATPTTTRAMRSRASLVRIAANMEFDSEAFSETETS